MEKTLFIFILCVSSAVAQKNSVATNSSTCIPVASVCNPVTLDTATAALGIGITFVGLKQIQNTSDSWSPILEDFTCTDSASLNMSVAYAFEVHTGLVFEEMVTAWIDFSNDGAFTEQEIVFHDSGKVHMHSGSVTIPSGTLNTFTPIRMRVGSDYSEWPTLNACGDLLYGHYEDYRIFYGVNIGIAENEHKIFSSIYPNPMQTSARIKFSGNNNFTSDEMQLCIYNCFGVLVSQEKINGGTGVFIERKMLSGGLYFYEVTNSKAEKSIGKFIVE